MNDRKAFERIGGKEEGKDNKNVKDCYYKQ